MPNKKVAKIDFVKAIAGISFATLAAIGGSTGNPLLAGLAAFPAAGLAAHNNLGNLMTRFKSQKENYLELPPPPWWIHDIRTWQNLCVEIGNRLPEILQIMQERMQQENQVVTRDRVQGYFIEALVVQHLTWEYDAEQKRHVGEFLAVPFLQKLDEILLPLIEQTQQERMLIDGHTTALYVAQTAQVLERIHDHVSSAVIPHALNDEEIATLRRQYNEFLYSYWRMLDFKGIMRVDMNRPISIPLIEVFVLPDALSGIPEYETLERETEEFRYGSNARKAKLSPPQRESLPLVLAKCRRLVLLGDPGSGKSTLLRYLLLKLVQGSDAFAATFPELSEIAAIVPLYMPLAAFAEVVLSNVPGTRSLEDFLPIYLRDRYLGTYVQFIQTQLERGNLLFLFDGLDEIPDSSLRMNVVRHIEMFTQAHPVNRFIVTTRIVGYKEASLSSEYQSYTLADFDEEQVRLFTRQWCPAYECWVNEAWESQHLKDAATKEAVKLFEATQSRPAVKRLAVNPLLLTILALIQRQGIELPSHRVELFELCAMTLIDTWVRAKGQSIQLSKNELIKILRPLAFWMHQHPAVGNIPEEELYEQIVQQLIDRSINEHEATKLAEQFLETVRGKTGILVERGKERYGFLHLTFEEYFAARELEKRKDRNDFIKTHLHDPRWREVILLTVGAIGILHSNEEAVTELVYTTITRAGSPYEGILHRDLLFAGHCLADDIGIRAVCEDEIIEQIVFLALTSPYFGLKRACSSVLATWRGTRIGEKATSLVFPILRKWANETDPQKTLVATTRIEKSLSEHIEFHASQYQEEMMRHLRFQITIILARFQALEGVNWITNLLDICSNGDERARTFQENMSEQSLIDVLLYILSDPDVEVKKKVINALGYLGDRSPSVIDALLLCLSEFNFQTRRTAICSIGQLGEKHPRIFNALQTTLAEQPYIKEATIKTLWSLDEGHAETIDTLLVALVDEDSFRIRQAAAIVLKRLGNEEYFIDDFLAIISNPTREALEPLAQVLARLSSNPDKIIAILLRSLSRPTLAREVTLRVLGHLGKGEPRITNSILSCLSEPNRNIKIAAIYALGQLGEDQPQIIKALISTLSDASASVRYAGINALRQLGIWKPHVIDALLLALSEPYAYIRNAAINALGQFDLIQPQVLDALHSAIHDSDGEVRVTVATILGQREHIRTQVLDTLVTALIDFDVDARAAAVDALTQFCAVQPEILSYLGATLTGGSIDSLLHSTMLDYKKRLFGGIVERLASLLKDVETSQLSVINLLFALISNVDYSYSNYHIRWEAAKALGQIGKKDISVVDRLLEILSNRSEYASLYAAQALEELDKGQPHVIDALIEALSVSDEDLSTEVVSALGKLGKGHPLALEAVLRTLRDHEEWYVKQSAAMALGKLGEGNSDIIRALFQALFGASWGGKNGASVALAQLEKGQPSIIDDLLPALFSSDLSTREMGVSALAYLDDKRPELVDVLLPLLSDPSWSVRLEVARALGVHDDKLSRSVDGLLLTLKDTSSAARYGAAYALRNYDIEDRRVFAALLQTLSDSDWSVRAAAAYALAISQSNVEPIGGQIEKLLREYDQIAHRELRDNSLLINALREAAEKISGSKYDINGSKK